MRSAFGVLLICVLLTVVLCTLCLSIYQCEVLEPEKLAVGSGRQWENDVIYGSPRAPYGVSQYYNFPYGSYPTWM